MTKIIKISLTGLNGEQCLRKIDDALKIEGILRTSCSLDDASVEVEYDSLLVNFNSIKDKIENTGYYVL